MGPVMDSHDSLNASSADMPCTTTHRQTEECVETFVHMSCHSCSASPPPPPTNNLNTTPTHLGHVAAEEALDDAVHGAEQDATLAVDVRLVLLAHGRLSKAAHDHPPHRQQAGETTVLWGGGGSQPAL